MLMDILLTVIFCVAFTVVGAALVTGIILAAIIWKEWRKR